MNLGSDIEAQMAEVSGSSSRASDSVASAHAGTKRKVDSDGLMPPHGQVSAVSYPSKRPAMTRTSLHTGQLQAAVLPQSQAAHDANIPVDAAHLVADGESVQRTGSIPKRRTGIAADGPERTVAEMPDSLTSVLPADKIFSIQLGTILFRLSGASLSSDAPSYFSYYFGKQLEQLEQTSGPDSQIETLYIDRDYMTFEDIAMHLQGYYVQPRDEEHYVRLLADAQFYSLPRLIQQLFKSEIFFQVGDRHFQIPRDIFSSPGDSSNYFSLGFAQFFSTPSEAFPRLNPKALLRPPPIVPPAVPSRSGDNFANLLHLLQGYDVDIRDARHRAELLRDARFFHFKGLEQRLLPCEINFNAFREREEILLRLEDLRQSGISFNSDLLSTSSDTQQASNPRTTSATTSNTNTPLSNNNADAQNVQVSQPKGWITYQRPFIDDKSRDLTLEISSSEPMKLDINTMRATFQGKTKARISSLFQVIANKLNLPAMMPLGLMMLQSGGGIAALPASPAHSGVSGETVCVRIDADAWVEVDGDVLEWSEKHTAIFSKDLFPKIKRWGCEGRELDMDLDWIVQKGQWRLRVETTGIEIGQVEVCLVAVRIEAHVTERFGNRKRAFLV